MTKNRASIWEERVQIPTYEVGDPEIFPMFLEKRVYQGSSGKVYPLPVIEQISDTKTEKTYRAVYLENPFIKVMILPELGGRIQMAYDKIRDYHFVYYNKVVKPALVGLAGPWISGGIEFNWPQHHRPSTFMPVEYSIEEENGNVRLWLSEIEAMSGTRGMLGICLDADSAYIRIEGRLKNRSSLKQTFLWWANPAVEVDDTYQSIFPPDVHAVFDHGKRAVSDFPVAHGEYYKMDYSSGVDISWYKNIPVPTSFMAYHSDFDFVGGYNHGRNCGILHIADHHISPGKKQWTWGNGDFGQAWDRNLSDDGRPYVELMTGVFTDNQPDFSWLHPGEEKQFVQYFMPYAGVANVKDASKDAILNFEVDREGFRYRLYLTNERSIRIVIEEKDQSIYTEEAKLGPESFLDRFIEHPCGPEGEYRISIYSDRELLLSYRPGEKAGKPVPEAARKIPEPWEIESSEELYLSGLHLEQYRHATYRPEDYYREALKRDPADIRSNCAMGLLRLRSARFREAESHFLLAIDRLCHRNPNPLDGGAFYYLGLSLWHQGRIEEAYDAFYKALWNQEWKTASLYYLSVIQCSLAEQDQDRSLYLKALSHIDELLYHSPHFARARALKVHLLKRLGKMEEARKLLERALVEDPLDPWILYHSGQLRELKKQETSCLLASALETALDLASVAAFQEAAALLSMRIDSSGESPLLLFYLHDFLSRAGDRESAQRVVKRIGDSPIRHNFPYRLEAENCLRRVLNSAREIKNPASEAEAAYALGNFLYDKGRFDEAIEAWEKAVSAAETAHHSECRALRNLTIAYFNKREQPDLARSTMERAVEAEPSSSRLLMEYDQLKKKCADPVEDRLAYLESRRELVLQRDDLLGEYIALLNLAGRYGSAMDHLLKHRFHPWEGGEGKITAQYRISCMGLAWEAIQRGDYPLAVSHAQKARHYPENLGEGKLAIARDNDIDYIIACCREFMGESKAAEEQFRDAAAGSTQAELSMYYNDTPAEMIFFQALSLLKLGNKKEAETILSGLYSYGIEHQNDTRKIDYFAVSLPDFLIFEEDLNRKNRVFCRFIAGLGALGLSSLNKEGSYRERSEALFRQVMEEEPAHFQLSVIQRLMSTVLNPA